MSGAGAGAGTPAPFKVSWEKLEGVFSDKVLKQLKMNGLVAEHVKDEDGDVLGLKVYRETEYSWLTIASLWNENKLHKAWDVDQGILKELLESAKNGTATTDEKAEEAAKKAREADKKAGEALRLALDLGRVHRTPVVGSSETKLKTDFKNLVVSAVNNCVEASTSLFAPMATAKDVVSEGGVSMFADALAWKTKATDMARASAAQRKRLLKAEGCDVSGKVPTQAEDIWTTFYLFPKLKELLGEEDAACLHLTYDRGTMQHEGVSFKPDMFWTLLRSIQPGASTARALVEVKMTETKVLTPAVGQVLNYIRAHFANRTTRRLFVLLITPTLCQGLCIEAPSSEATGDAPFGHVHASPEVDLSAAAIRAFFVCASSVKAEVWGRQYLPCNLVGLTRTSTVRRCAVVSAVDTSQSRGAVVRVGAAAGAGVGSGEGLGKGSSEEEPAPAPDDLIAKIQSKALGKREAAALAKLTAAPDRPDSIPTFVAYLEDGKAEDGKAEDGEDEDGEDEDGASSCLISRPYVDKAVKALAAGHVVALCEAVEFIHSQGVLHCDIRPPNVLTPAEGYSVKLIDFGRAFIFEPRGGTPTPKRSEVPNSYNAVIAEDDVPVDKAYDWGAVVGTIATLSDDQMLRALEDLRQDTTSGTDARIKALSSFWERTARTNKRLRDMMAVVRSGDDICAKIKDLWV